MCALHVGVGVLLSRGLARPGLSPRVDLLRMLRAKSGVRNSPSDPADPGDPHNPLDQVSGGAIHDLTSSRTGGQDDGSFANSLNLQNYFREVGLNE